MIRANHIAVLLAAACTACVTSYSYEVHLASPVDPLAFERSLGGFLHTQGFQPFQELHSNDPRFVADVTHGLPRWDKLFKPTWPKGGGFVAVELDRPYNP